MTSRRTALALLAVAFTRPVFAQSSARPAAWAEPVLLEGAPNLHRITPLLYRSAQPSATGFANLAAMGIRTVVSLRQAHDDAERARGTGLVLHRIPIDSHHIQDDKGAKVVQTLRLIIAAQAQGPVLLHCHYGADRTGTVSAVYRMAVQGWTNAAALDELMNGGYGFHTELQNIPAYVASVDVNDILTRLKT